MQREERFFPDSQAKIKEQAAEQLSHLSEADLLNLIGLVSSRMVIEDHAKTLK